MADIMQEIETERAQIQAQERDLNIKKIQLAIKELYAAFADGQVIRNDNTTLEGIAERLSQSVVLSQRFPKGAAIDPRFLWPNQDIPLANGLMKVVGVDDD
jgi:hypothetical protein